MGNDDKQSDDLRVVIDREQHEKAVARLVELTQLSKEQAKALALAVLNAAVDHALELINGSGSVPTAMTTARADQLSFICKRANRQLSRREVEILFRVTPASAQQILTTLAATYGVRELLLTRMRADVRIEQTGTQKTGLTWTLRFSEDSTFETAWSELERLKLATLARRRPSASIEVPRELPVDVASETKDKDVLALLGIQRPEST